MDKAIGKKILQCMNDLQIASRAVNRDWATNLGKARGDLVAAIREAVVDALPIGEGPAMVKERADFLAKFDKLFTTE